MLRISTNLCSLYKGKRGVTEPTAKSTKRRLRCFSTHVLGKDTKSGQHCFLISLFIQTRVVQLSSSIVSDVLIHVDGVRLSLNCGH
jgi:hypothetical protein